LVVKRQRRARGTLHDLARKAIRPLRNRTNAQASAKDSALDRSLLPKLVYTGRLGAFCLTHGKDNASDKGVGHAA
jgi:hypothetical protein